jgi:hypothetical protein
MKKLILTLSIISTILLSGNKTFGQQTAKHLQGRYIMKGSGCAGFNFVNAKTVLWYNESACLYPDTLKIKWVDDSSFLTITKTRTDNACPPRVEYYKIVSNVGKQLVLKSVWTGWNDVKDQILTFTQK